MYRLTILCLTTVLCLFFGFAFSEESVQGKEKDKKVLVLIIANDGYQLYHQLQQVWRSYMHLDPDHIEAYFIKGDPNMESASEFNGDTLWTKTAEGLFPGILRKTILSMETFLPRMDEFSYCLRTNLSSFYIFPRLLEYIKTLPKERCYAAVQGWWGNTPFASGCGFLLSPDMVKLMIEKKEELWDDLTYDDVVIGKFFHKEQVSITQTPRTDFYCLEDWENGKDSIPPYAFHIRAKGHIDNRVNDFYIHRELAKMFYGVEVK